MMIEDGGIGVILMNAEGGEDLGLTHPGIIDKDIVGADLVKEMITINIIIDTHISNLMTLTGMKKKKHKK